MDDMTAFERLVAGRIQRHAGPIRPVDDVAIFTAITATQSPRWSLQSMFSATKLVIAGAIVALVGGFLLLTLSVERPTESVPAAPTGGPGTFRPSGTLTAPRAEHTATLLQDGRVLVVGGYGLASVLASAEIWDPATESFEATGSLGDGRADHTATRLQDGRVLVVGGFGEGECCDPLASAEIWDPATGSFEATGSLARGRAHHTATLLRDGRVLVVGGNNNADEGASSSAEIWDPVTGEFQAAGALTQGFYYPTATRLADGRVLVVGSVEGRSAEIWDPATASFSPTGSSAAPHLHGLVVRLLDDRVLAVGGTGRVLSAEVWDPETGSFGPAGSLGEARASHSATLLSDGRVLVVGGGRKWDDPENWGPSAEIWDPATESFGPAGSLATGRGGHSATALSDGRVLVIGGADRSYRNLASAEVWAPVTDSRLPSLSIRSPRPDG